MIAAFRKRPRLLVSLLLIGVTLVAFWQTLDSDFINLDDSQYVTDNVWVTSGLTFRSAVWAFTTAHASNWHPLTWLSHMLNYQLYGLNPMGHHLTNVLLHILSTLLLFLLIRRMTGRIWHGAFVAALFAIHPLHVESVAWVSERKDVLSGLFWILTTLAYVNYTVKPSRKRYFLTLALFAMGLMAKPMLVTLPLTLLLLDYWPLGRFASGRVEGNGWPVYRSLLREKIPFFALVIVSSAVTFYAQQKGGSVGALETFTVGIRVENALVAYVAYIGKMFWPSNLAVFYPHPGATLPAWQPVACAIFLLAVSVIAIRARRTRPYFAVGWFWYVVTLVPVIGLVQVGGQAMADRYMYVPLIGLFLALAWGIPDLLARFPAQLRTRLVASLGPAIIVALAAITWQQVGRWRDPITLFKHTVGCTTNNFVAYANLADALARKGRIDEALVYSRQALQIAPNSAEAHSNLGGLLHRKGNTEQAIAEYREALNIDPHYADAHYNMGISLASMGKTREAAAHFRNALKSKPDLAEAHNNLGLALARQGDLDEAIVCYNKAISARPNHVPALVNLGDALAAQGNTEEAIEQFTKAKSLDPSSAAAHNSLGKAMMINGRAEDAVKLYREAVRLRPDFADAHCNLGVALAMQSRIDEALTHLYRAVKLMPEHADAHANLAVALFHKRDYRGAWAHVHLARKYEGSLHPKFLEDLSAKMPDTEE